MHYQHAFRSLPLASRCLAAVPRALMLPGAVCSCAGGLGKLSRCGVILARLELTSRLSVNNMMIFLKLQSSTSRLVCDLCFATSNFKRWVFWSQRWLIHPDDNNEVDDLVQLLLGRLMFEVTTIKKYMTDMYDVPYLQIGAEGWK